MKDNIKYFKLINGDEIVGEVVNIEEGQIIIKRPLLVKQTTNDNDSIYFRFFPFMFSDDELNIIKKDHVMFEYNPIYKVKECYYNMVNENNDSVEVTDKSTNILNFPAPTKH